MGNVPEEKILLVGDTMRVSSMYRKAEAIDPAISERNAEVLREHYTLKACKRLNDEAWSIVFGAIITGSHGLAIYQLLPTHIVTSPLCVAILLESEPLYFLALSGKIGYYGIVRLAHYKGIWVH